MLKAGWNWTTCTLNSIWITEIIFYMDLRMYPFPQLNVQL